MSRLSGRRRLAVSVRWAVLILAALFAVGLVFPVEAFARRDGSLLQRLLDVDNCKTFLGQGFPLLAAVGDKVSDAGEAGASVGDAEGATSGASALGPRSGDSGGIVAWLFAAVTGVDAREPSSFLTAELPLARSPYAATILAFGRSGQGSGSGGQPLQPGQGSGSDASHSVPGTRPAGGKTETGVPEDATLEDEEGTLCLYGGSEPIVAIVHSHGSESFLPVLTQAALAKDPKADTSAIESFTTNPAENMIRVGEELARYLADTKGIPVVQSRKLHDAQADGFRLGAYERSLVTMTDILRRHPTVKIMLDLHRDAPERDATTTMIDGVSTSTICIIVGTDKLLENDCWRANYDFARRLVAAMEQKYPGLSRGILVRDERYNQHVMARTLLLEIGGQENTLEEEFAAVHDLGDVLAEIVAEGFE